MHLPVESRRHPFEKIPMVAHDARFVFHNAGADEWFGKVSNALLKKEKGLSEYWLVHVALLWLI